MCTIRRRLFGSSTVSHGHDVQSKMDFLSRTFLLVRAPSLPWHLGNCVAPNESVKQKRYTTKAMRIYKGFCECFFFVIHSTGSYSVCHPHHPLVLEKFRKINFHSENEKEDDET